MNLNPYGPLVEKRSSDRHSDAKWGRFLWGVYGIVCFLYSPMPVVLGFYWPVADGYTIERLLSLGPMILLFFNTLACGARAILFCKSPLANACWVLLTFIQVAGLLFGILIHQLSPIG